MRDRVPTIRCPVLPCCQRTARASYCITSNIYIHSCNEAGLYSPRALVALIDQFRRRHKGALCTPRSCCIPRNVQLPRGRVKRSTPWHSLHIGRRWCGETRHEYLGDMQDMHEKCTIVRFLFHFDSARLYCVHSRCRGVVTMGKARYRASLSVLDDLLVHIGGTPRFWLARSRSKSRRRVLKHRIRVCHEGAETGAS